MQKKIQILKSNLESIKHLRLLFLQQNQFQFVHNKCHIYGWADQYLFMMDEEEIGYGAVWGKDRREDRDTIFEFYMQDAYSKYSSQVFSEFLAISGVQWIECQTNDPVLSSMLFEYAVNIQAEAILFNDMYPTEFSIQGAEFQKGTKKNLNPSDSGEYIVCSQGEIVATGGFMLNYNLPYADIYMEVKDAFRRMGLGSFIIQELKKEIYRVGRVPAARCNINNLASKSALVKAGFKPCGFLVHGEVKPK
ncbi:MAG: GNAT family N-acetyltransferase [Flavisolibacter sp.]